MPERQAVAVLPLKPHCKNEIRYQAHGPGKVVN